MKRQIAVLLATLGLIATTLAIPASASAGVEWTRNAVRPSVNSNLDSTRTPNPCLNYQVKFFMHDEYISPTLMRCSNTPDFRAYPCPGVIGPCDFNDNITGIQIIKAPPGYELVVYFDVGYKWLSRRIVVSTPNLGLFADQISSARMEVKP